MGDTAPLRPSFEDVYRRHAAYVWRTLRRLGVAERHCVDAVQDVFVIVLRRLPEYEPRDRMTGWLAAIARKVAAPQRRREQREPLMDTDLEKDAHPSAEEQLADHELLLRLLEAVELDRRTVLILHDLDDLSIPEIARALGIPEGTAWSRLRLAHQDLEAAWSRMEARERREHPAVLPFGLAALIEAERSIPPMPEGMHDQVWARLQHLRDVAPDASPRAAGPRAVRALSRGMAALTTGGALMLGVALGAIWDPLHQPSHASSTPPPATAAVTAPLPALTAAPSAVEPPSATAVPSTTASTGASQDITTERSLMDQAARALARNDPAGALAAVQEHARRFPGGQFVEERERYAITALVRAGRIAEARERVDRFARAYPNSARLDDLRRALGAAGTSTP